MSQRLLIAYDRNTVGLDDDYDYIYDEFGTLEELVLDWLSYSPASYVGPWKIIILDRELFPRFKKDFLRLSEFAPVLKSFEDVWTITYIIDPDRFIIVEHPTEAEMQEFERLMGVNKWTKKKEK